MSDMLEYKGYHGTVEYSAEDNMLFGSVFGVNDSLNYGGRSLEELIQSFQNCIENYLDLCAEIGKEPDKEFRGTFNVRIKPELHKQAALQARKENISLNSFIEKAIEAKLSPSKGGFLVITPSPVQVSQSPNNAAFDRFHSAASVLPV